jgi:hypothetical protein
VLAYVPTVFSEKYNKMDQEITVIQLSFLSRCNRSILQHFY